MEPTTEQAEAAALRTRLEATTRRELLGDDILDRIARTILDADAAGTTAAYHSELRRLAEWYRHVTGDQLDVTDAVEELLPMAVAELIAYLEWRTGERVRTHGQHLTVGSLRRAATHISNAHRIRELESPVGGVILRRYLKHHARERSPNSQPAPALTRPDLETVIAHMTGASQTDIRDRAIVCLLGTKSIGIRELARVTAWTQVSIPYSPALPTAVIDLGGNEVTIRAERDPRICPVVALEELRRASPNDQSPPFAGRKGPLNASGLLKVAQRRAKATGVEFSTKAMTPASLSTVMTGFDEPALSTIADQRMIVLAWWLGARGNNLTHLVWDDLHYGGDQLKVRLRKGKSYVDAEARTKTLHIQPWHQSSTCPVRAIADWRQRYETMHGPGIGHCYVFPRQRAGLLEPTKPRGVNAFNTTIKKWAAEVLPDATGHSTRAGFITTAVHEGHSLLAIASHVDHASVQQTEAYMRRGTDRSPLNPTIPARSSDRIEWPADEVRREVQAREASTPPKLGRAELDL